MGLGLGFGFGFLLWAEDPPPLVALRAAASKVARAHIPHEIGPTRLVVHGDAALVRVVVAPREVRACAQRVHCVA